MLCLQALAVNETLRMSIYFDRAVRDDLGLILMNGNEIEKKYVLGLLCQLSFDMKIASHIGDDPNLMGFLNIPGGNK